MQTYNTLEYQHKVKEKKKQQNTKWEKEKKWKKNYRKMLISNDQSVRNDDVG